LGNQNLKYKISRQKALEQHRKICGVHKPIQPEMPKEGKCVEFEAWKKTIWHPFAMYADFETLLMKTEEKKGGNTQLYRSTRQ